MYRTDRQTDGWTDRRKAMLWGEVQFYIISRIFHNPVSSSAAFYSYVAVADAGIADIE